MHLFTHKKRDQLPPLHQYLPHNGTAEEIIAAGEMSLQPSTISKLICRICQSHSLPLRPYRAQLLRSSSLRRPPSSTLEIYPRVRMS
jgi:hypothetical protein